MRENTSIYLYFLRPALMMPSNILRYIIPTIRNGPIKQNCNKRHPSIHHTHHSCTPHPPIMYTTPTTHVHHTHQSCTPHPPIMYTTPTTHVHHTHQSCTPPTPLMYTTPTNHVHHTHHSCTPHPPIMYTTPTDQFCVTCTCMPAHART